MNIIHSDQTGFSPSGLRRLERVLQREVDEARLPGAIGLIGRSGSTVWQGAFGIQSPGSPTAMAENSLFRIFSMTKPLVSVAIMMLLEEGRLTLAQPVSDFIAEFSDQKVSVARPGKAELEPVRRPATIQDLLRHTAGLTYEFLGNSAVQRAYGEHKVFDPKRNNAELMALLGSLPLQNQPGSTWEYSRATDVLGRVIEVVSGQSLGSFLSERVLGPLNMMDTAFQVAPGQEHRIAEPFANDPLTGAAVKLFDVRRKANYESGGGGLISTLPDYARFLKMMLNRGQLDGRRLLSRKTVDFMTADHLGGIPNHSDLLPPGHGFGLGFAVRLAEGVSTLPGSVGLYFWGGIAGTTFWVDPVEDFFAVLMIQAPNQRDHYRGLFRSLVYSALE